MSNDDDQLGPKVRAILQDVIPEAPVERSLLAGARVRVRRRRRIMTAGASLGVAAIAAAVIVPTALLTTDSARTAGAGGAATASSSAVDPSATTGTPTRTTPAGAWADRCFSPWTSEMGLPPTTATPVGRPAPQFVGKSRHAIDLQAAQDHFRVVIVGAEGHCQPWVSDAVYTHHVYLALDTHDQVVAAREDGFQIR